MLFQESGKRELSLSNVAGIFYILIAGLVFAIVLASAEFLFKKSKLIEKVCSLANGKNNCNFVVSNVAGIFYISIGELVFVIFFSY